MKYPSIVLFGPPYGGKGTVGKVVAEQRSELVYVVFGDVVKKAIASPGTLATEILSYITKGNLIPDHTVLRMFSERLKQLIAEKVFDPKKHILLIDGIPRTYAQAAKLYELLDVIQVLHFTNLPNHVLAERCAKRVAETIAAGKQPRIDDSPEACKMRIADYYVSTFPTLDFYVEQKVTIVGIDALGTPDVVVKRTLEQLYKRKEKK